jgi:hypothetical protein
VVHGLISAGALLSTAHVFWRCHDDDAGFMSLIWQFSSLATSLLIRKLLQCYEDPAKPVAEGYTLALVSNSVRICVFLEHSAHSPRVLFDYVPECLLTTYTTGAVCSSSYLQLLCVESLISTASTHGHACTDSTEHYSIQKVIETVKHSTASYISWSLYDSYGI